jgi:hypothetical protein
MEVPMRQRGAQSRRERPGGDLGTFGAPLGSGGGGRDRFWPTVAMIAIVIATAGWTTVAVLVMSGGNPTAANAPSTQIADASPSDDLGLGIEPDSSDSPEPESHVSPALEALLPKTAGATALTTQSWTGATLLSDDGWSDAFTKFLQGAGKTPADLLIAQGYDQTGNIDLTVAAFKISGVSAADVRKTLVNAWKADYPELATTSETVGGKKVTKGVFQDTGIDSYWYEHEDLVYDVETADSDLAATVLAALP